MDKEIYKELGEIKGSVGRMEGQMSEFIRNTNSYIAAVSKKADDIRADVFEHIESQDAHGVKAERRGRAAVYGGMGAILGGLGSTAAVIGLLYKMGVLR